MKIHEVVMYLITQRHLTHKNLLYMFAKPEITLSECQQAKSSAERTLKKHETSSKLWLIKAKLTVQLVT